MFYSVDLLRMKKNRKGRLPKCWLAATTKSVIGTGPHKLSKEEVKSFDISAACDDILEGITGTGNIPRCSLYLSSQLTFGAVKLLDNQINLLEEDCYKLLKQVLQPDEPKSIKKPIKPIEKNEFDLEIPEVDLTKLFPDSEEDMHLLQEFESVKYDDRTTQKFNDGFGAFDHESLDIRQIPELQMVEEPNANESEQLNFKSPSKSSRIQVPGTPKRKTHRPHDETPTKRKRTTTDSTPLTPDIQRIRQPSEAAISPSHDPTARRSIFQSDMPTLHADTAPGDEIEPNFPPEQRFSQTENVNVIQNIEQLDERSKENFIPLPVVVDEPMEATDMIPAAPVIEEAQITDNDVQDNVQQVAALPPAVQDDSQNDKILELEESLNSSILRRQRKSKEVPVFDAIKQVQLVKTETPMIYIKPFKVPKEPRKIRAKILLTLPSTGLKKITNSNRSGCSWGMTLQNRFLPMFQTVCENTFEETFPLPRNKQGDKNIRLSAFKSNAPLSSSTPHTSTSEVGKTTVQISEYYDPEQDATGFPMLPLQNEIEQQSQLKHRGIPKPIDSVTAVSPRQSRRVTINPEPMVAENADEFQELPVNIPIPDDDNIDRTVAGPHQPDSREIVPHSSSQEIEVQTSDLIISMKEFYLFLKKMWNLKMIEIDEGIIKIKLHEILPPSETSIEELIKYLNYCYELEKRQKLYLKQEIAYDSVDIIKFQESEEEFDSTSSI